MTADPDAAARRLAAIVNSSDDAIVSKDLNGIVQSWNASAERIFGYTAAEMIGQSILKIIPLERRGEEEQVLSRIRRRHSSGSTWTGRARHSNSDPAKFHKLGKSRHCCGLTPWIRQSSPSRKMQAPSGPSCRARPVREAFKRA
mgnify:CR=1 FL=1